MKRGGPLKLLAKVRRRVQQEPAIPIVAYSKSGLSAGFGCWVARSGPSAAFSIGIPLGEAAAGSSPQDNNSHNKLNDLVVQFGASVAVDFGAQGDFNDLGGSPGHSITP